MVLHLHQPSERVQIHNHAAREARVKGETGQLRAEGNSQAFQQLPFPFASPVPGPVGSASQWRMDSLFWSLLSPLVSTLFSLFLC